MIFKGEQYSALRDTNIQTFSTVSGNDSVQVPVQIKWDESRNHLRKQDLIETHRDDQEE